MASRSFRLEPLPGYAPTIGRLVDILLYARQTTLAAVEGLSIAELDHLQDDASNSIGALQDHADALFHRGVVLAGGESELIQTDRERCSRLRGMPLD